MNEMQKSFIQNGASFLMHYNDKHDRLGRFARKFGSVFGNANADNSSNDHASNTETDTKSTDEIIEERLAQKEKEREERREKERKAFDQKMKTEGKKELDELESKIAELRQKYNRIGDRMKESGEQDTLWSPAGFEQSQIYYLLQDAYELQDRLKLKAQYGLDSIELRQRKKEFDEKVEQKLR